MRKGSTSFGACKVRCWRWLFGNKTHVSSAKGFGVRDKGAGFWVKFGIQGVEVGATREHWVIVSAVGLQGYLAHKKQLPPLGPS